MPNTSDTHKPQLTCVHPLSEVNKQIRLELFECLGTSSLPIVTRVLDFDFLHVQRFLSTLDKLHQDAFKVRADGVCGRKLIVELQGPYTASFMDNLHHWIEYVHDFVGLEKQAELCALYKTIDNDGPKPDAITIIVIPSARHFDGDLYRRVPIRVLKDVYDYYSSLQPGSSKIEVHKIMRTLCC
jgi:hypothetical protein